MIRAYAGAVQSLNLKPYRDMESISQIALGVQRRDYPESVGAYSV